MLSLELELAETLRARLAVAGPAVSLCVSSLVNDSNICCVLVERADWPKEKLLVSPLLCPGKQFVALKSILI